MNTHKEKAAEIDRQIGARLRSLRRMAGFSPFEFARLIGCSEREIERYETGRDRLTAARLFEATRILGITIDDLFAEIEAQCEGGPTRAPRISDLRVKAVNETHLQALLSLASAHVTTH